MSIQDDIFDVQDALKDFPEHEALDRIIEYLDYCETNLEKERRELHSIHVAFETIGNLIRECVGDE